MLNIPMWLQIPIFAVIASIGCVWLLITIECAWGLRSKRFQVIWLIINIILDAILLTIIALIGE